MRRSVVALCLVAAAVGSGAQAGSLDDSVLRGTAVASYADDEPVRPINFAQRSAPRFRWQGFYAGGQVGYSSAGVDFGHGTQSLIDFILRNDVVGTHVNGWNVLDKNNSNATSFGAFAGYNYQMDELIIGIEGSYTRPTGGGIRNSASDSMTRRFQDDAQAPAQHHYFYTVTVASNAASRVTDFGTLRARAAFAVDRFLPYAFVGGAIGRVDIARSATVAYSREDIPDIVPPPAGPIAPEATFFFGPETRGDFSNGVFAYGLAAGLGMDVAILPNVFMRGEWEYVKFAPVHDFNISINTVRAGLGVRF